MEIKQDVILEALTKAGVDDAEINRMKRVYFDSDIPYLKSIPEHKFYEVCGPFIRDKAKLEKFRENIMASTGGGGKRKPKRKSRKSHKKKRKSKRKSRKSRKSKKTKKRRR